MGSKPRGNISREIFDSNYTRYPQFKQVVGRGVEIVHATDSETDDPAAFDYLHGFNATQNISTDKFDSNYTQCPNSHRL
jgi:hypothetical protein